MKKEEILTKALNDIIEECPKPKLPYGKKVVNIATTALTKAVDVDALVIRNATEIKRKMLHELGELIRSIGRKEPKRHGNYWYFDIDKYYFKHDDYNNGVTLYSLEKKTSVKHFGIDWGGFETGLEIEDFENALHLIKGFIKLSGVPV